MDAERTVQAYLGHGPRLVLLLVANGLAFLVGVSFYVHSDPSLRALPTLLYPLFADSPTALALVTLSLSTLVPHLGGQVADAPQNRPLAYLHTLAFVWLVKFGLWTVVALNLRADLYVGFAGAALWDYWGIMLTHVGFVIEAAVLPAFGRTTRGALAFALVALLANDGFDYLLGYHPPLKYDPGVGLAAISVGLSVLAVGLASRSFRRLDAPG